MTLNCLSAAVLAALAAGLLPPSAAAEDAPRGREPHGALFLPPDFYPRHREALQLSDEQIRELQAIATGMREPMEKLEPEMRDRTRALKEAMAQNPVDAEKAMERFKAVLHAENEMKALHFRTQLVMRRVLTPEQNAKAQQIAMPAGGANADHVRAKLQQVREQLRSRSAGGEPPREALEMLERIQQAVRDGHLREAEKQLDSMLSHLRGDRGDGEGLETRMRQIAGLAERTENPELRERLQRALQSLREAAESGNREAVEKTLKSIEPVLRQASKDAPK